MDVKWKCRCIAIAGAYLARSRFGSGKRERERGVRPIYIHRPERAASWSENAILAAPF